MQGDEHGAEKALQGAGEEEAQEEGTGAGAEDRLIKEMESLQAKELQVRLCGERLFICTQHEGRRRM